MVGRLGVVGGHTVLGTSFASEAGRTARTRRVAVAGGPVTVADADDVVFLQRHGSGGYVPPHAIDHHAHAAALVRLGCDRVLGVSSVGALHDRYPVGTVLVPDDFVALTAGPTSRFADARGHGVPGFDRAWRDRVLAAWRARAGDPPIDGGTYWQVAGPRFETPAEVRFLAAFADVVGMTMASECEALRERGIPYASVCVVDNLANGVGRAPLSVEEFETGKAANRDALVQILQRVVDDLA